MKWTLLDRGAIDYDDVVLLAKQVAPTIAEDDALFDEVACLNRIIEKIPADQLASKTPEQKWKKIFGDGNFSCLLALIR